MSTVYSIRNVYDYNYNIVGSVIVQNNIVVESSFPEFIGRTYTDVELSNYYCFKTTVPVQAMCNSN